MKPHRAWNLAFLALSPILFLSNGVCGFWNHPPTTMLSTSRRSKTISLQISKTQNQSQQDLFPVLSQIQGINWGGECRYTDENLKPLKMVLLGGTRYDLDGDSCTMSSYLVFPDGRRRQVQMKGRRGSLQRPSMRLDPVGGEGPIYMVITELAPDTILLNEVEIASGKIVMTSSLSIVNGGQEIFQVSHEVGSGDLLIEGHQVWRLKKNRTGINDSKGSRNDMASSSEGERSNSDFRGTTGR